MNNVIMRSVEVTSAYEYLSAAPLVFSGEISASPDNSTNVVFQADDGSEVSWAPGEYHSFKSVDLAKFRVKGNAGDVVTAVGGTW